MAKRKYRFPNPGTFAKLLRKCIKERRTLKLFAADAGMSRRMISRYANSKALPPNFRIFGKLCITLGYTTIMDEFKALYDAWSSDRYYMLNGPRTVPMFDSNFRLIDSV